MNSMTPVLAAGAVCWRESSAGKVEVLLVHRPRHQDLSFPKGKVDPDEPLPAAAVREVAEETGLSVALGVPLGNVEYTLPTGRGKRVSYWAAEVGPDISTAGFDANSEVDEVHWMDLDAARRALSYEHDVDIIDRFAELHAAGSLRTFAIIALRHGKAVPHQGWTGPDHTRPLLPRGREQAVAVAGGIASYRPRKLITSTAKRCRMTIKPTRQLTGLDAKKSWKISEDAFRGDGVVVAKLIRKRLRKRTTTVLCSHSPVLPQIIAAVAAGGVPGSFERYPRLLPLDVGDYAVLHVSVDHPYAGIVAVEVHRPGV